MPRKTTKKIARNSAAKKPPSKTKFILAQPKTMAAKDVVAKGQAVGLTLTEKYVWQIRSAAKVSKKARAKTAPAPKAATPAAPGRKPGKIAQFVLAQEAKVSAPEVVKLAKAAGFDITAHRVHNIRWRAQRKGKAKPAGKAAPAVKTVQVKAKPTKVRVKPGQAKRAARRAPPRLAPPKPTPAAGTIAGIDPLDLVYAVGRLVADGKTTAAEVINLAAERTARILALKTELETLKGGQVPRAELTKPVKPPRPRRVVAKPAAPPTSKKAKPKAAKKPGTVKTHSAARKFTMTPKALAARKLQGKYLGYLRQVPEGEKPRFKAIAKEQGVAAVVAELTKRLGKG